MSIRVFFMGFLLRQEWKCFICRLLFSLCMEGDGRYKEDIQHKKGDNYNSTTDEEQEASPGSRDLDDNQETLGGVAHGSVLTETGLNDADDTSDQQHVIAVASTLPQFDELLPQDSPKPSRKSKPQRKAVKRSLSIPSGSLPESHTVSKQRRILPKEDPESTQSTSKAISPTSLANILLELSDILAKHDVVDGSKPSTSTSSHLPELTAGEVDALTEADVETVEPKPGPSGIAARPSTLPLTVQSSTSSSQGSPSLAATTDEVVKVFVYGEDEEVKQAAAASEQSRSVMPLIKEELRTKIQLRRLWSGGDELQVEPNKEDFKLSLEEVRKRERKKAQNRRSATRSREKQARREENIIQNYKKEESKKKSLKKEIEDLLGEKDDYLQSLNTHLASECSLPRRERDAKELKKYLSPKE